MGNQNSYSSGKRRSKYSKEKNDHQRQLVKSAPCGTITSEEKSQQVFGQPSDPNHCVIIQCNKELPEHKILTSSPQLNGTTNKYNNIHHYNIHHPKELLGFKSFVTSDCGNEGVPFGKRSNSALDFLAAKSPLNNLLKGRLGKGSCDRLDIYRNKEDSSRLLSPKRETIGLLLKSGSDVMLASQKMNCNLDKFAKLLAQLSGYQKQCLISKEMFKKHVAPHSLVTSKYLWTFFANKKITETISESNFVQSAEKIYALITDKDQITFYLKAFGNGKDSVDRDEFVDFLIGAYQLFATSTGTPVKKMNKDDDFDGKEWIESVTKSCYHIKDEMSICFLSNWLLTNIPRFLIHMHKYILHQLTTGYTQLTTGSKTINTSMSGVTAIKEGHNLNPDEINCNKTEFSSRASSTVNPILLWLLRSTLPSKYVSIFDRKTEQPTNQLKAVNSAQLILQLMHCKLEPEKWSLLYDSDDDGLSINRFQFHLFNYRGPSILIVKADNGYTIAIASDNEWKESCHFWGGEDTILLQLEPEFRVVEKGAKILYANFSIRGYPFGIQVGKDPKKVSLDIKPDFSYAHFKQIPCRIQKFVAYGCAPSQAKASQTEFKKWEAKQCEKIRTVNINSAEWKDNPDKYLLELAGAYRSYDN